MGVLSRSLAVPALRASYGFCEQEPAGKTCLTTFRRAVPVGADCGSGTDRGYGEKLGVRFSASLMKRGGSNGLSASQTAALRLPKKGRKGRKNQERQGYKMDDRWRRRGDALGLSSRFRFSSGGLFDRGNNWRDIGSPQWGWASEKDTNTTHLRQGCRFRSIAVAFKKAWNRLDMPTSGQQEKTSTSRRSKIASVLSQMED